MYQRVKFDLSQELQKIDEAGLYKEEQIILSDQKPEIKVRYPIGSEPMEVLNFCSNKYLGLANHSAIPDTRISG